MKLFKGARYASVTATLALVVALSGTSYAAVTLAKNSVGTAQLKNNAVISSKVKNGSLQAKDIKPSQLTKIRGVRWALVNANHTAILAQSGGISIAATSGGGTYLDMGADVSGKVVQATNAYLDTDGSFKGGIIATICGGLPYGGTCAASGTNTPSHVWVFTENTASTAGENHAFYVAVF